MFLVLFNFLIKFLDGILIVNNLRVRSVQIVVSLIYLFWVRYLLYNLVRSRILIRYLYFPRVPPLLLATELSEERLSLELVVAGSEWFRRSVWCGNLSQVYISFIFTRRLNIRSQECLGISQLPGR